MALVYGLYVMLSSFIFGMASLLFIKQMRKGNCEGPLKVFCCCLSQSRERQQMCYLYCCFCHILDAVIGFIIGLVIIIVFFSADSSDNDGAYNEN